MWTVSVEFKNLSAQEFFHDVMAVQDLFQKHTCQLFLPCLEDFHIQRVWYFSIAHLLKLKFPRRICLTLQEMNCLEFPTFSPLISMSNDSAAVLHKNKRKLKWRDPLILSFEETSKVTQNYNNAKGYSVNEQFKYVFKFPHRKINSSRNAFRSKWMFCLTVIAKNFIPLIISYFYGLCYSVYFNFAEPRLNS